MKNKEKEKLCKVNKVQLVRRVSDRLRNDGVKKTVNMPKAEFYVSDPDGNSKKFTIRQSAKEVSYNADDVLRIVDAVVDVMEDSLRHGEVININGFGQLGVKYHKPMTTIGFDGLVHYVEGYYFPKFTPGADVRKCAALYSADMKDKANKEKLEPESEDELFEDDIGDASGGDS